MLNNDKAQQVLQNDQLEIQQEDQDKQTRAFPRPSKMSGNKGKPKPKRNLDPYDRRVGVDDDDFDPATPQSGRAQESSGWRRH